MSSRTGWQRQHSRLCRLAAIVPVAPDEISDINRRTSVNLAKGAAAVAMRRWNNQSKAIFENT